MKLDTSFMIANFLLFIAQLLTKVMSGVEGTYSTVFLSLVMLIVISISTIPLLLIVQLSTKVMNVLEGTYSIFKWFR